MVYRSINICRDIRNHPLLFGLTKKDVRTITLAEDTVKFTAISFFWLLFGFAGLYYMATSEMSNSVLVTTGLYVPIILIITGVLIRSTAKLLIKDKKNYEDIDKKIIILCGSVILSGCMFLVNWRLALFLLAIILGKYIWIDFVFDYKGIIEKHKEYKEQYFYYSCNSISISINLLTSFAYTFVMCTLVMGIFEGAPLWVQITNAVLTYVVVLKWVWAFHKDREIRFDYETEEIIEKIESMDTESGE